MEKYLNKITCGDSYELIKDLPDNSVDCIYTDIPYLYSVGGGSDSDLSKQIRKTYVELADNGIADGIDYDILNEFVRISKKVNLFIWCSKMQIPTILNFFVDKGYFFEILTWHKTNPIPATNGTWLPDTEYCLYFRETGVKLNDGYDLKFKYWNAPINQTDKGKFNHPTIKPLPLVERNLAHVTQPNDIVLDCFIGSGTTAVACKNIGRQYIGFEILAEWVKVANDRLDNVDAYGRQSLFTI